jgi:hypothetical protein
MSTQTTGTNSWIETIFAGVMSEYRHHTNPAHHRPLHIEPIHHPVQRTLVAIAGVGMLGLAGVGAVTPIMPTWPFALVALICFARSSRRVRNWTVNNHVIKSMMSLVYARPERPFVWARKCLNPVIGAQDSSVIIH